MLTPEQITTIDRHLRKENWLLNEELIAELTDHYINGLEERLSNGKTIGTAISEIHNSFGGRKGLLNMEENFQKSQVQHTTRLLRGFIASYFRLPRLFMTTSLFVLIYSLIKLSAGCANWLDNPGWVFLGLVGSMTVLYSIGLIRLTYFSTQAGRKNSLLWKIGFLLQGIQLFLLVCFYANNWLPQQFITAYPILASIPITLFAVYELAVVELLANHISKKSAVKTT